MSQSYESLEGWLFKKKSSDKFAMFSKDNKRWFRIKEFKSNDSIELALCYFKSPKDADAKGWLYMRDITEISGDKDSFTVVTPSRNMTLEAGSNVEMKLWLSAIVALCPDADTRNVTTQLTNKFVVTKKPGKDEKSIDDRQCKDADSDEDGFRPVVCSPEQRARKDNNKSSPDRGSRYAESKNDVPMNNRRKNSLSRDVVEDEAESTITGNTSDSCYGNNSNHSHSQPSSVSKHDDEYQGNENQKSSPVKSNKKFDRIPRSDTMMYSKADINKINMEAAKISSSNSNNNQRRFSRDSALDHVEEVDGDDIETLDAVAGRGKQHVSHNGSQRASSSSDDDDDMKSSSRRSSQVSTPFQHMEHDDEHVHHPDIINASVKGGGRGGIPPPAPTTAPPRRAKDVLDDLGDSNRSRKTIEEIISSRRSTKFEHDLSDDEAEAKPVERKEMAMDPMAKMADVFRGHHQSSKPPPGTKNPYIGSRSRQSSQSNIAADKNFVSENWDDDDNDGHRARSTTTSARSSMNKCQDSDKAKKIAMQSTVQVDSNWLEEDFDS